MHRSSQDSRHLGTLVVIMAIMLLGFGACRSVPSQAPDTSGAQGAESSAQPLTAQHDQSTRSTGDAAWPALDYSPTIWNAQTAPEYYRVISKAQIDWDLPAGTVEYAPLDTQGRATGSRACVTYQLMETGRNRARADSADLKPSGWGHNAQVEIPLPDGDVYRGELWNRSHLLAKSLGGAEQLDNLVTGTRMQNVGSNSNGGESGGMGYCEGLARAWLDAHHDGTLLYSAVPVYLGSELVCRSVVVDLRSSDGTLDQRVEVYNAAAGYEIDYETGTFREAPGKANPTTTPATTKPTTTTPAPAKKTGWQREGNAWHHYANDGTPSSGWVADNGSWYLLHAGAMLTGWQAVDGLWYYLNADGRLASNQWVDNTYYVDEQGAMLTDARTPDGFLVDAQGVYVPEVPEEPATLDPPAEPEPVGQSYVLNHNTMKFHHPSCRHVPEIKPKNRIDVVMTREDVIAQGYVPCKVCNP